MTNAKLKYQPSLYIERRPDESPRQFHARILADGRLLQDQRTSLEQDHGGPFDDLVKGIWLEQAPLQIGEK